MTIQTIILAAGLGKRMCSKSPKVLQTLAGKPLLVYVLNCVQSITTTVHIICGGNKQLLQQNFANSNINWISQPRQLGTADAVSCALPHIDDNDDVVLILYGDVPLIKAKTLKQLIHKAKKAGVCLLSAKLDNPDGYGRMVRNTNNQVCKIIEQKNADTKTLAINEVNTGIMAVAANLLHKYLPKIKADNECREFYLTDLVKLLVKDNIIIDALLCADEVEVAGVNDKQQLAQLERKYQQQLAAKFSQNGLQLLDPNRFDCRGNLTFNNDCVIDINVIIKGDVKLGNNVIIEANCIVSDCVIGDNCHIYPNSILENAILEKDVQVGPFARIRPQTKLSSNSKIGNFVEVKKSLIGSGSKVNHLSYIGDSTIGNKVNIGAGVITCNYDGVNKHQSHIGDNAFIGSNTALIAPLKIGQNATIGAGSAITKDVADNQLGLSRAQQLNSKKYKRSQKA